MISLKSFYLRGAIVALSTALFSISAHATPGSIVSFSQSGTVTATLQKSGGDFGHLLDIGSTFGPVTSPIFAVQGNNMFPLGFASTPIGTSVNLGSYVAGNELEFRLTNIFHPSLTYPSQLFTGPGSRNANGLIYADVTSINSTTIDVAFNDLLGYPVQTAFDNFRFELTLTPDAVVPEPGTFLLMGLGFLGLSATRRKR